MHSFVAKCAGVLCAGALCASLVAGCGSTTVSTVTEEQQANRDYMAQVNQKMESLGDDLDKFSDAVARQDIISMRTQAENAFKELDALAAVEAPEALADVHESYVSGVKNLREALSDYIDLYTEIQSATEQTPFDWSTYDQRVAAIQELYSDGLTALAHGDEVAAGKE